MPEGTVQDWLRGLAPRRHAPGGLARTLATLRAAGCPFSRDTLPGTGRPGGLTGIDHLGLLTARHRRELEQRPRIADPGGQLPARPPWHVVNVITTGRLLTAAPGGILSDA